MAWKPLAWKNSGRSKAEAAKPKTDDPEPEDDDDDDPILDPEDDDDETEKEEQAPEPAPTPAADATATRLAALEAENERLRAQLGEQTLPNAQKAARQAAVRFFGQGTPQLTEAKKLIGAAESVPEVLRQEALLNLAISASPLGASAGERQTTRPPITADPNADTAARAKAAAARTRPRSVKPGNLKED